MTSCWNSESKKIDQLWFFTFLSLKNWKWISLLCKSSWNVLINLSLVTILHSSTHPLMLPQFCSIRKNLINVIIVFCRCSQHSHPPGSRLRSVSGVSAQRRRPLRSRGPRPRRERRPGFESRSRSVSSSSCSYSPDDAAGGDDSSDVTETTTPAKVNKTNDHRPVFWLKHIRELLFHMKIGNHLEFLMNQLKIR